MLKALLCDCHQSWIPSMVERSPKSQQHTKSMVTTQKHHIQRQPNL